jgi:hypothetical protein
MRDLGSCRVQVGADRTPQGWSLKRRMVELWAAECGTRMAKVSLGGDFATRSTQDYTRFAENFVNTDPSSARASGIAI